MSGEGAPSPSSLGTTAQHIPMLSTDRDQHEGHGLLRHQLRQTYGMRIACIAIAEGQDETRL